MNPESKSCQNCKSDFQIFPEDVAFLEKISTSTIKFPLPTWCPDCRMQRRMVWRNERVLFSRECDFCKKKIISMYPAGTPFPVYCHDCWWSGDWEPLEYGRDYDFSRPFFSQFKDLLNTVPRVALESYQNTNSPFTTYTWFCKNVYLSSSVLYSENIFNSPVSWNSTDVYDAYQTHHGSRVYESVNTHKCANIMFCVESNESLDSSFLYDCRNCNHCFMSSNLRNKSYVFRNQELSKSEYEQAMATIDLTNREVIAQLKQEFLQLKSNALHRFAVMTSTVNSSGNNLTRAKNAYHCFTSEDVEDLRYSAQTLKIKDGMDLYGCGDSGELIYEGVNVGHQEARSYFNANSFDGNNNVWYSDFCRQNCQELFGCNGLRKKQYCILNKQYSKEAFDELRLKIFQQMNDLPYTDTKGRVYTFGEFFPVDLTPFAYNNTIAHSYFPLTKESAEAAGFTWRVPDPPAYKVTLNGSALSDKLGDTPEDILNQIISCAHADAGGCTHQCTKAFRFTKDELDFHYSMGVALPNICLSCRFEDRLIHRMPIKLWQRTCTKCSKEIESPYEPTGPEKVYCESCYLAAVA